MAKNPIRLRSVPAPIAATKPSLSSPHASDDIPAHAQVASQVAISDMAFESASQRLLSSESVPVGPAASDLSPTIQCERPAPATLSPDAPEITTSSFNPGSSITPLPSRTTPSKSHSFGNPMTARHSVPSLDFTPVRMSGETTPLNYGLDHNRTPLRSALPPKLFHFESSSATKTPEPVDTPGDSPPMERVPVPHAPPSSSLTKPHAFSKDPASRIASSPASSASSGDLPCSAAKKNDLPTHHPNPNQSLDRPHTVYGTLSKGILIPANVSNAERRNMELMLTVPLRNSSVKKRAGSSNVMPARSRNKPRVSVFEDDDSDDREDFQDEHSREKTTVPVKPRKPGRPPNRTFPKSQSAGLSSPSHSKPPKNSTTSSAIRPKSSPNYARPQCSSPVETPVTHGVQQPQVKRPRGRPRKVTAPQSPPSRVAQKSPSDGPKECHEKQKYPSSDVGGDDSDFERVSKGKKRRAGSDSPSKNAKSPKGSGLDSPHRRRSQRTIKKVDYSNCDNDESDGRTQAARPRSKKRSAEEDGPIGSLGQRLPKLAIEGLRAKKSRRLQQELPDRKFSQLTSEELSTLRLAFVKHYPTPPSNLQAQAGFERDYGILMTPKMVEGHWKNVLEPWSKRWWDFYGMFNDVARERKLLKPRDRDPTIKACEAARWAENFYKEHGDARIPSPDDKGKPIKLNDEDCVIESSEAKEVRPKGRSKCSKRRSSNTNE